MRIVLGVLRICSECSGRFIETTGQPATDPWDCPTCGTSNPRIDNFRRAS